MKIARITLAQVPEQRSVESIGRIVSKNRKSHIIVFPEYTLDYNSQDIVDRLRCLAKKYDTRIIIGMIYRHRKKTYDYSFYISGRKVERYQKVHVHWTEKHVPGKKFTVFRTGLGKMGLLMCYDVAYIESSLLLRKKGAEIITVISSIPHDFKNEYFNLRLRAIAYFNQVFVIHCCKPGMQYSGHSSIVNPKGRIIKELGKHKTVSSKTIDMGLVSEWRKTERLDI